MIYQRGKVWYMNFNVGTERVHRTTGLRDREQAMELAESIKESMLAKKKLGGIVPVKLSEACAAVLRDRWEGTADYDCVKTRLRNTVEALGDPALVDIDTDMLEDARETLEQDRHPRTVDKYYTNLRTVLRWACNRKKLIPMVPEIPMAGGSGSRDRVISPSEERTILDGFDALSRAAGNNSEFIDGIKDMVCLMLDTLIRPVELHRLTDDMIDLDAKVIRMTGSITKNKKPRNVPMTDRAFEILSRRVGQGQPVPYSRFIMAKKFKAVKDTVGLLDASLIPYTCRHTGITRLLESGVDLYIVGMIAGHSNTYMTERYGHLSLARPRSAIEKLNGYGNAQGVA